ncbi:hypothetical protein [Glycomyces harbinensis]|uniref:DUF2470 domain-containing protein n=1 Tax=Glycomyces harbinensis TaxID=58114 RepID=A0A1G6U8C3_9ACTN|nr:hypothetical protein [Glycomyces harbinensis]SDD37640.1 hypothetical protein SAMN05216270_103375 [Glycomyces harbinensis]
MRPSAAEVARTLARGRLKGALRFADGIPVTGFHHATDRTGRPLLLAAPGDEITGRLRESGAAPDVSLTVDDVPPLRGAPSLGRIRLTGTLSRVPETATRAAVLEYARSNPIPELFDVGDRITMHRIELRRVSLNRPGSTEEIDPLDYAAAEPDPLHECEGDLLQDLAHHHSAQLDHHLRHLLEAKGAAYAGVPRAMRLDRYGFVIDLGDDTAGPAHGRWLRLEFARPVCSQHDLAHLMHPILFHHHTADGCEH